MKHNSHALFMIDFQIGNMDHVFNSDLVLKVNVRLLEKAREAGILVIHFKYHEEERDFERFGEPWTAEGTLGGNIHPSVAPCNGEKVYTKPSYGAFTAKRLEENLAKKGIKTIWLAGVMSQVCVLTSAYEGYARGYDVNVLTEAVGATNGKNLEIGLEWMLKYAANAKKYSEFEASCNRLVNDGDILMV